MKDVISVIVPVYNVAAYLPQCLDSILGQDHEKLEVILIDDGSKDESGAICEKYAAQDSRVKVIHQQNAGAAAAKNAGLRAATGEYLSFVDSDDYLEPEVYGYMLSVLKETGADVVQFAFRDVYRVRTEDQVFRAGRNEEDQISYLRRLPGDWTCSLLWNKLYKRSLYDGIFFEEGHRIDDEYFTYQGIMNAKKIVCDDRIIYNYRKRASGAMSSPQAREKLVFDRADSMCKRRIKVSARYPELKRDYDITYLDALGYLSRSSDNSLESMAMLKQRLKEYLREAGNTRPAVYLWPALIRQYCLGAKKLLKACDPEDDVKIEEYCA